MNSINIKKYFFLSVLCFVVAIQVVHAASVKELSKLSLEQFSELDLVVTSVSRKPQKLSETAAAVFVISNEDIKRSGVTSIPEALRMAPGVQVARIDANKWAITSRGFNGRFANKLLVLMDGRTIYTPLFSGVYWDSQDTLLEDIDRIEVIRGPATAIWGGNSMNGVINIITKKASDTQGGLFVAGAGTEVQGFAGMRYGGKVGDDIHYRLYGKYSDHDSSIENSGSDSFDERDLSQAGFRLDWDSSKNNFITLQSDIYNGNVEQKQTVAQLTAPFAVDRTANEDIDGFNIIGRWNHQISEDSSFTLQMYYDHVKRKDNVTLDSEIDTFDIDFQHQFKIAERHSVNWGGGYRLLRDELNGRLVTSFTPVERVSPLYTAFIQDDISFLNDELHLILGSKFEHNDFTGFEVQPNVRLRWSPNEQHTTWAAVSRGLRIPDRSSQNVRFNASVIPGALPTQISIFGSTGKDPEEVIAYELGYRRFFEHNNSLDISLFYNDYSKLRTRELGTVFVETTPAPLHVVQPISGGRKMHGESYGIELAGEWNVRPDLVLKGTYTYFDLQLHADADSTATSPEEDEGRSPHHQASLLGSYSITEDLKFHTWLRYVDELPDLKINDYITMDVQLSWSPVKNLELSLLGQNLIEDEHQEFSGEILSVPNAQIQRGVFAKLQWQF
jgi:iron complex outermembrane recepter protein